MTDGQDSVSFSCSNLPFWYRYEAQSQSEQTHMLPVEGIPQSKKDYRLILMELQTFMETNNKGSVQPLLFAKVGGEMERIERNGGEMGRKRRKSSF